ncbi:MAG: ribonuclease [Peptococcaceae bacterium]|jgi:ribonuclease-3|nr:ribonuclease [Peptococcaceae bacterium]
MNGNRKKQLEQLLEEVGIKDKADLTLVHQALIHPSYVYEGGAAAGEHNQRLEFLGDAVVGLVIGQFLFEKYPHKTEGELTKMRAAVVCEPALARAAQQLNLGQYLLLGRGEEMMGGAKRPSNLADCFEAFAGALYLTVGLDFVRNLILRVLHHDIIQAAQGNYGDFKTQLQEYIQRAPESRVSYQILKETGPDHDKLFLAAVYCNDEEMARGRGRTKKEAEQQAARLALLKLGVIQ